jgi:pimeloyl-ACP methyl ester carboxylesterase
MVASERISIAGLEVDLRSGGRGRDLLFLHPGSGLGDHEEFLEKLASGFRVTAPSHPGFDGSDNHETFTRVGDLAYFYLDLIEAIGLHQPLIVGSSLGAWLALEVAQRCKSVCCGLVLIGPLGAKFGSEKVREIVDLFSYPVYEQDRFLYNDPRLACRSYADAERATLVRLARNFETFARLGWSPTLFNPKLRSRLGRLTMPTLIVRGENDKVVSEDYCRNFANAITGAHFRSVPNAGHYAHIEEADWICAQIAAFAQSELANDEIPSQNRAHL